MMATLIDLGDTSTIVALDEDALVEVLRAAKAAGSLASLASTTRRLCRVGRKRLPSRLRVSSKVQAESLLTAGARGMGFSGCVELHLEAGDPTTCLIAVAILGTAQQWASLRQLSLSILKDSSQQPPLTLECATAGVLSAVPALQQLRQLELDISVLGACSVAPLQHLTQITSLQLTVQDAAAAAAAVGAGAAPDLTALSGMTNLVELFLINPPAVQPAAGPEGPFCLPSSLVTLEVDAEKQVTPGPLAGWVTHLRGCQQLQHLGLQYGNHAQHHSVHPSAVAKLLAQHNPQLRTLTLPVWNRSWGASVPGLPDAAGAVDESWHPSAALAQLTGLDTLAGGLYVRTAADWQHLSQLPRLTQLSFASLRSPPPEVGFSRLQLLKLHECSVHVGGYAVGQVLLACPLLEEAVIEVCPHPDHEAAGPRLPPHPKLHTVHLHRVFEWGDAAPREFAALLPVLAGVSNLVMSFWDYADTEQLPDLSCCTALTRLSMHFYQVEDGFGACPEQEDVLAMLAPLAHLQELTLQEAPRLNARVALVLQHMLPQLQRIRLVNCGTLLPEAESGEDEEEQQQAQEEEQLALAKVQQLLRPGLVLEVDGVFQPDHRYM